MISKRFSSKKASKFSKRVLGMESLESRELLSINPLGYDGSDVVQTNANFSTESDFEVEASTLVAGTAGDQQITATYTPDAAGTYTIKVFTGGSSGTNVTGSVTVTDPGSGTAAQDTPVTITVSGLTNDTAYTVVVNDGTTDYEVTMTPKAPATPGAEGEINVKGGTVVTGLTTNAATVTLPKVKNAKTFVLYVNGDTANNKYYEGTKNQVVMSGLTANGNYELLATFQDKDGKYLNLDGTVATDQTLANNQIDLGKFTTFGTGDAADVTNPAINGTVAATYTLASKGKEPDGTVIATDTIKVTWKAPTNYTGAYTIVVKNTAADGTVTTATKTIPAGSKAEAYVKSTDGGGNLAITKDAYYSIQVIAGDSDSANAALSPEVVVATGTVKIDNYVADDLVADPTDPQSVATAAPAATANAGFSLTATVTAAATPGSTIGYWVALYDAAGTVPSAGAAFNPDDTNIIALAYVATPATGDPTVNFGGLDTTKTYKAVAWAVNAAGKTGDAVVDGTGASPLAPTSQTTLTTFDKAYAGSLKASAVSGTATSTKVEWKSTKAEDDANVILGWQVSYSADGGENWILASTTAAGTLEYTFTGLNQVGVIYQFKVQAIVQKTATVGEAGLDKGDATVANAKANVASVTKVAKVNLDVATATSISANWDAVAGASGYLVTVMNGKGVAWQGIVSTNAFNTSTDASLLLVAGLKYDIIVSTVQYNGDMVASAKAKGSFSTLKFSDPTLKIVQGEKAGLTSVNLALTDKIATAPTGTTRSYVVEYTYVANAKGKADWSAASTVAVTDPAKVALTALKAGTQYYARVVAYDTTNGGTSDSNGLNVIGKEFKFKTAAAPLPTVSKSGFALNGNDLEFTFTGKYVEDKNDLLATGTTVMYELIVSSDAVVDKATGKLANGKVFGSAGTLTPYSDAEIALNSKLRGLYHDISAVLTGANGVFDVLDADQLNLANFKQLNFQLKVYYTTDGTTAGAYAEAYTKVAKIAMPKWFA